VEEIRLGGKSNTLESFSNSNCHTFKVIQTEKADVRRMGIGSDPSGATAKVGTQTIIVLLVQSAEETRKVKSPGTFICIWEHVLLRWIRAGTKRTVRAEILWDCKVLFLFSLLREGGEISGFSGSMIVAKS